MEFQVCIIFEYVVIPKFLRYSFHYRFHFIQNILIVWILTQIQEIEYFHDLTISTLFYYVKINFKFKQF